jgi:hypothetical protein
MSEANPPAPSLRVQDHLHTIAQLLRDVDHLGPEAQRVLAELVDELGDVLEKDAVPSPELAHLTECTAQLMKLAQEGKDRGLLERARTRVDGAVLAVEAEAPLLAGIVRRLTATLANLGI